MQILIKCRLKRHFIWVFTVCHSTSLGVSSPQKETVTGTNRRQAELKTESKQAVYIKINIVKQTRAITDNFNDNRKDKGKMQISDTDERGTQVLGEQP